MLRLRGCLLVSAALALLPPPVALAGRPWLTRDGAYPANRPHLSSSGAALFREELAAGRLRDHPLARRQTLPWGDEESAVPRALASPLGALAGAALAVDAIANSRVPATCAGCQNLPLIQTEAGVALLGVDVVASWNNGATNCIATSRQNYGWSVDGGATFTDAGGFPSSASGSRLFGDASVSANARTGRFYIGGLSGGGSGGSGVGAVRGDFGTGSFVIDRNVQLAYGAADFLDKPWLAVDSLSGNVYMSWTNFRDFGTQVEFLRCDADLNPLGPVQVLSDTLDPTSCGQQFSQPVVGPEGEVWVVWVQYQCDDAKLTIRLRRSDDFGATFGPPVDVIRHAINYLNGGPGFLRPFATYQPHLAVDRSNGPHRGRLYLSFDGAVDWTDDALPETTTRFESEPNDTVATANVLVPGGKLRGIQSGLNHDWFRIDLQAGQTFYLESVYTPDHQHDSTTANLAARLWCPAGGGLAKVVHSAATSGGLLFTANHTGPYYLQLQASSTATGTYVFQTALIPAQPGEVARDNRDQLVMRSDDGVNWTGPVRINDSAPGEEGQYPTIGVDGQGRVHVFWMDYREDAVCGALSTQYTTASGDGGVSWGANRRLADELSSWAGPYCNQLNGNTLGDYQSIATDGDRVASAFNDGRLGDPDIFVDVSWHHATSQCPPDATAPANADTTLDLGFTNAGNFERTLHWEIEDSEGWIVGVTPAASGTQALAVSASRALAVTLHAPVCDGDSTIVRLRLSDPAIPGDEDTCTTVVRCGGTVGVPPGVVAFRLGPARPNPSTGSVALRLTLPAPGPVRAAVFTIGGARVRTLADGAMEAGARDLFWDGRDARGRAVPSGAYFVRVEAGGRRLARGVVVAR